MTRAHREASPIVIAAMMLAVGAAAAIAFTLASLAFGSEATGIDNEQRPWIVLIMALADFGLMSLFLLLLIVWAFGTARIPAWAREAWWKNEDLPPAPVIPRAGTWSAARVALAVFATGALVAALGAPLLGILIGWLLNPNDVLTAAERWIVVASLVGEIAWGIYLLSRQRRPQP